MRSNNWMNWMMWSLVGASSLALAVGCDSGALDSGASAGLAQTTGALHLVQPPAPMPPAPMPPAPMPPGTSTPAAEPNGATQTTSGSRLADVFAMGADVVALVDVAPSDVGQSLLVEATTSAGYPKALGFVQTWQAGPAEVVLPGAIGLEDIGAGMTLRLFGADAEPVSKLGFRTELTCDGMECEPLLLIGVVPSDGSVVTSLDFDASLDEALLAPGGDVLGAAAASTGQLGAAVSYAAALGRVTGMAPSVLATNAPNSGFAAPNPGAGAGPGPQSGPTPEPQPGPTGEPQPAPYPTGCLCYWQVADFLYPDIAEPANWSNGPVGHKGFQGPGPAHWLRNYYDGGIFNSTHDVEHYVEGNAETTMSLRCLNVVQWVEFVFRIFGQEIRFWFPLVDGECEGCQGIVDNFGEYYADLHASVDAGWWSSAQATSQEEGRYTVNGQPLINRIARVGKEIRRSWSFDLAIPGLGKITFDNGKTTVEGDTSDSNLKIEVKYSVNGSDGGVTHNIASSANKTVVAPATATFESKGLAYCKGDGDADAQAKTTMSYSYAMFGNAPCALQPTASMWHYYSYQGRTKSLQNNLKKFFWSRGLNVNP